MIKGIETLQWSSPLDNEIKRVSVSTIVLFNLFIGDSSQYYNTRENVINTGKKEQNWDYLQTVGWSICSCWHGNHCCTAASIVGVTDCNNSNSHFIWNSCDCFPIIILCWPLHSFAFCCAICRPNVRWQGRKMGHSWSIPARPLQGVPPCELWTFIWLTSLRGAWSKVSTGPQGWGHPDSVTFY